MRLGFVLVVVCFIVAGCGPTGGADAGAITGIITDAFTGLPISGATVKLAGASTITGSTGANGSYKLSRVPVGTYTVSVAGAAGDSYITRVAENIAILKESTMLLDLTMARAGELDVLLYVDTDSWDDHGFAQSALDQLGITYTQIKTPEQMGSRLTSEGWHLLVVDNTNYTNLWANTIEDYVDAGGLLVMSTVLPGRHTSYAEYTLWSALGVDYSGVVGDDKFSSKAFTAYRWDKAHPVFTAPNGVPDLRIGWVANDAIEGVLGEESASGQAIAGSTASYDAGSGLIFVTDTKRTVFNSFLINYMAENADPHHPFDEDNDGVDDGLELWRNEIAYVLMHNDVEAIQVSTGPAGSAVRAGVASANTNAR